MDTFLRATKRRAEDAFDATDVSDPPEVVREESAQPCSICLGPLNNPCITSCGHTFNADCLTQALKYREPWDSGSCPMCRQDIDLYSTTLVATGKPLLTPDVSTIFGCAFLQNGSVGVASYHFESPDECYISYEHAPEQWKLGDGSRPPPRKPFLNPKYDEATRTFTGTIEWEEGFNGDARWEYEMIFSRNFRIIRGGQMQGYARDGTETRANTFPRALRYWRMMPDPSTLVGTTFIQFEQLGMASYHFEDGIENAYISYEAAPDSWQLDTGGRPPAKKPFLDPKYNEETRTFTGLIEWEEGFGGDALWEYTMVFDETFASIVDGSVKHWRRTRFTRQPWFKWSNRPGPSGETLFGGGRGLEYRRYDAGRAEIVRLLRMR